MCVCVCVCVFSTRRTGGQLPHCLLQINSRNVAELSVSAGNHDRIEPTTFGMLNWYSTTLPLDPEQVCRDSICDNVPSQQRRKAYDCIFYLTLRYLCCLSCAFCHRKAEAGDCCRKKTVDTRHTLTQFGDWSGPSRHYLLPAHRALWLESPSEEDWCFRLLPV